MVSYRRCSLLLGGISERAPRVEDAEIVGELDIARAKLERNCMLLGSIMQCIQRLCLSLRYCGDVCASGQAPVPDKRPPGILNEQSLRVTAGGRLVVQQRPPRETWRPGLAESVGASQS